MFFGLVLRVVFWGLPGFWRRVGCMCDYVVLPLLNLGGLGRLLRGLWMWI